MMRGWNGTWAAERWVAIAGVVGAAFAAAACSDSLHLDPATNAAATTTGGAGGSGTTSGAGGTTSSTSHAGGSGGTTHTTGGGGHTGTGGHAATGGAGGIGGGPPIGCASNSDCPAPRAICDTVKHDCVECLVISDCAFRPGTVCSKGECACPTAGQSFCDAFGGSPARCVDLTSSSTDCGACDHACFGACAASKCVDQWEPTSLVDAPAPRARHAAVWTGTQMIVWGGETASGFTNTGGIYDPAKGTWTPTSIVNAPSARTWARAVWTGTRMVVWGGLGASGPVATGGAYDPTSNTWTSLSTDAAPAARYWHTLVWAGPKYVIAFGGYDGTNDLADGGRYDPSTDTWSSMATDTARHEHSATWTGANGKMIVFGGIGGVNWLGDVNWLTASSQYDPTGDAWSPLQPNGVSGEPVARARHTAVWTDTELLVWGGTTGGNTVLGNGAKFKVQETSWTPMNEPSPAPRKYHTAVWLGSKMLVWGGLTTNGVRLDSGATFDPLTNKWDPKPLPTAPLARAFHTGLATDKAMIVWGGETANGFTNTGGIYTP